MAGRPKKTLEEQLPPEFIDAVKSMGPTEINERISTVAKGEVENQAAKEADDDLAAAKEKASELAGPYSDASKLNKLKLKYLHQQLKAKGGK